MKPIFKIVFFFLILLFISIFYLKFNLNKHINNYINDFSLNYLQTSSSVEDVNISFSGKILISDFKILNPEGFSSNDIFYSKKFLLHVNPKSLFEDVILIEEIKIENPELLLEINKNLNINFNTIKKNIENKINDLKRNSGSKLEKSKKIEKKIIIKKISVTNIKLKIANPRVKKKGSANYPDLIIQNIGVEQNGVFLNQIADLILNKIIEKYLSDGKKLIDKFLNINNFKNEIDKKKNKFNKFKEDIKEKSGIEIKNFFKND